MCNRPVQPLDTYGRLAIGPMVLRAEWKNSSDVKANYASASIVGAERVVFNVKGNAYRLVAAVDYRRPIVFIKWLGTHKDYDAIDVRTIQYATEANQD